MNRIGLVAVSMLFTLASAATQAQGLAVGKGDPVWPSWQARHLRLTAPLPSTGWWAGVDLNARRDAPTSSLLLGDYYFSIPGWQPRHGSLRASSGLMLSARPTGAGLHMGSAGATTGAAPYLGLGYAGLSVKGAWTLSADIGLVAENPQGALQFGRALLGPQSLDAALRDMRLTPLVKMAVNYAF